MLSDAPVTDVVIRSRLLITGAEFVVYVGGQDRPVGGPFTALADAVNCALSQATPATRLFYEALDERGRSIGGPMQLRFERH